MRPGSFYKNRLLTDTFGEGRCHEVARELRMLGLYPMGGKYLESTLTVGQATLFLLLLATNTTPANLRLNLDIVSCINSTNGDRLFTDLVELFKTHKLDKVKEIEIYRDVMVSIFAVVRFTDGSEKFYNPYPAEKLRTSCILPASFLKQFAAELSGTYDDAWKHPNTNRNLIRKDISSESLQKLIEEVAFWDVVKV